MLNVFLNWLTKLINPPQEKSPVSRLEEAATYKEPVRRGKVLRKNLNKTKTPDVKTKKSDDSSFTDSAMIAYATDSTVLGYALGGDLGGALLGDTLNSNCGTSSGYDSCDSSYDSGSSSSDYSSGGDF